MKNIDNYIIDFAKQIEKNNLLLSYDLDALSEIKEDIKNRFMVEGQNLFNFDKNINDNKKCNVENIFLFNKHFDYVNVLVKISIDDFTIKPIIDGNELNALFGCNSFDMNDKGILVVSHKKKIVEFARAIELDGNILFIGSGNNSEYAIDDELYDKDIVFTNQLEPLHGAFLRYKDLNDNSLYDFQLAGLHNSIEDYFNMQKSIINLYMKKEEDKIKSDISNVNYQMLGLQNKLNRLNEELNSLNAKHELQQSKIDSARIAYDLMDV